MVSNRLNRLTYRKLATLHCGPATTAYARHNTVLAVGNGGFDLATYRHRYQVSAGANAWVEQNTLMRRY